MEGNTKDENPAIKAEAAKQSSVQDERTILTNMHKLEKSVVEKGQLDAIPSLLETCTDANSTSTVTYNTVRALQRVFTHLISKQVLDLGARKEGPKTLAKDERKTAARAHFKHFVSVLIGLLVHRHDQVKATALKVVLEFLQKKTTIQNTANSEYTFPTKHFAHIIENVLRESNGNETGLFTLFVTKFLAKYYDIRYYTLKSLKEACQLKKAALRGAKTGPADDVTAMYLLLQKVKLPTSDSEITSFWIPVTETAGQLPEVAHVTKKQKKKAKNNAFLSDELKREKQRAATKKRVKKRRGNLAVKFVLGHKTAFESCLLAFLSLPLTTPIYKDVLRRMDTHILPCMTQPVRLLDFLKDSYDEGGVISLYALHGLFILITKHNLDYPEFYKKLYSLFQPNIFHVKYRAKFFKLVNVFLKSSHLPAYLVAAFVKRLARMALHAPPSGALFVIAFAYNMLKRHQQLQVLIHHGDPTALSGNLLPDDPRKPTGAGKQQVGPVLLLGSDAEAALNGDDSAVLMLNGDDAEGKKRKRENDNGDGEEAAEGAAAAPEEKAEANGEAAQGEGQHAKKRRRRRRGGAQQQQQQQKEEEQEQKNGELEASEAKDDDAAVAADKEEEEKVAVPAPANKSPIEQDEAAIGRYLHAGAAGSDPFVFEELDPQKCHAIKSSLWELKALQHHYVPQVSKLAKIFDDPLTKQPFELEDFLDLSYLSLFEAHTKKKTKSTATLAYQPQETLFSPSDSFQSDWVLE